jgi:transcriptional antiterminator NusG
MNNRISFTDYQPGDKVRIRNGTFASHEGHVTNVLDHLGLVRIELSIFGRPVPVELELWQIERTHPQR